MWTKTSFVGFVLCLLRVNDAALVVKPQNAAYLATNQQVTLNCQSNITNFANVLWYTVRDSGATGISSNGQSFYPDDYTITGTSTPGSYNLQIISLSMDRGGTYRCVDNRVGPAALANAEIIALASNPECSNNVSSDGIAVEGEIIQMSCAINYSASSSLWAPIMRWTGPSGEMSSDNLSSQGTSKYSIFITITPQMNRQRYSCQTLFDEPPPDFAANTPSYQYQYNSNELNVQYQPYNLQLNPSKPTYNPGDQVTCSADSNPGASFQWKDLNTNETTNGKVLTIPGFTEGGNNDHRYVCIATNPIKGQEYSTESSVLQFSVVPTPTTTTTTTTTTTRPPTTSTTPNPDATQLSGGAIAGIVIGCLLFLVLIGLLIIFLYRKQCFQSNKNKAANNTRPQNSRETAAKSPVGVDQVRHPQNNLDYPPKPGGGFPAGEEPPPYNTSPYGSMSREVPYHPDPMYDDPRARNAENLHYADLALDDTPRSRKPVQLYDNGTTDYAEIKRV